MADTKSGSAVVKLDYPITSDGTELRVLTLRRPKVRDVMLASKSGGSDEEKEVRVLSNLCELPPDSIQEMDLSDYKKLQDAYMSFFQRAPLA